MISHCTHTMKHEIKCLTYVILLLLNSLSKKGTQMHIETFLKLYVVVKANKGITLEYLASCSRP